jgi:hypothetical protein
MKKHKINKTFRTRGYDLLPPPPPAKPEDTPGTIGEGKLGVYDHKGRLRGQVGKLATSATVSRFIGQHGAKLGTKDGRPAWLAPMTLAETSAKGTAAPDDDGDTLADISAKGATATKIKAGGN